LKTSYLFLAFFMIAVLLFLVAFLFHSIIFALIALPIPVTAAFAKSSFSAELEEIDLKAKRRVLDATAYRGKAISVVLEIQNLGPTQSFTFEDVLPDNVELVLGSNKVDKVLKKGERLSQKYSIRPLKRGLILIEEIRVTIFDRTGLFSSETSILEETEVIVHVKEESLKRGLALAKRERIDITHLSHQRWFRTRDFEFDGIRDYVSGDRMRDIHWKSVSKYQKLFSKLYKKEAMVSTTILLDCSRSMRLTKTDTAKIDHGVHLSLEISKILLAGYHPTGIVIFDEIGVIDNLAPSVRKSQFDRILMMLRKVPPHVIGMPSDEPIPVNKEPEVGEASVAIPPETIDDEAEPFLSTIATFASKSGIRQRKVGLEGILRSGMAEGRRTEQLFVLISDLEAGRESILRGATLAAASRHKIIIASPFSSWYETTEGKRLTVDELDEMYSRYASKLEDEKLLSKIGVLILDIGPKDEAFRITQALRRRLT